jgi:hypothetical protein
MKGLQYRVKGEGEPCKQGETSTNTGCIPAEGDAKTPKQTEEENERDQLEDPEQLIDKPERTGRTARDDSAGREPGRDDGGSDAGDPRILTVRGDFTTPADPNLVPENVRKFLMDHQTQSVATMRNAMQKYGGGILADGTRTNCAMQTARP